MTLPTTDFKQSRIETDSMGSIEVPGPAYWGAQTARALIHFQIGQERLPTEMIRALAVIKKVAAEVNRDEGKLPPTLAEWIIAAAEEIITGGLQDQFPISLWQSGSGTQSNMNANEVIANRANELAGARRGGNTPIHPNDHVNLSQSSNDVFITAMHIAAAERLHQKLIPSLERMHAQLDALSRRHADLVKMGRTHLQDAVPMTVGQEFSAWATVVGRGVDRLRQAADGLLDLALGGTAIGTGLNAPPHFGERTAARIASLTGLPFRSHPNKFAIISQHDELVFASAALSTLAGALLKIANDIRLLASGPRCGLGELILPANEPGSSIMPGKINPTQCEVLAMVAIQVQAAHVAVTWAGGQGHLQLNVYRPVMIWNFLHAARLLEDSCRSFVEHLLTGLQIDVARVTAFVEKSLMLVTALAPRLGYERAAAVAKKAHAEQLTLREACLRLGYLTAEDFDAAMNPRTMIPSPSH